MQNSRVRDGNRSVPLVTAPAVAGQKGRWGCITERARVFCHGRMECMARYPGLTLRILAGAAPAMGPGKARLIEYIDSTGSISAAAREMGMSSRRAWQLVDAINASFSEPVVLTAIGGKRGGGAVVTDFGRRVVEDSTSAWSRKPRLSSARTSRNTPDICASPRPGRSADVRGA